MQAFIEYATVNNHEMESRIDVLIFSDGHLSFSPIATHLRAG